MGARALYVLNLIWFGSRRGRGGWVSARCGTKPTSIFRRIGCKLTNKYIKMYLLIPDIS
jgi:hypothetical protein